MKKTLHIVTIIFTIIYFFIAITAMVKRDYSLKISPYELELVAALLVFICGFICSFDYPLITAILFFVWSILIWIIPSQIALYSQPTAILDSLMSFASILVFILAIFYIFYWWTVKSKW